ncbi:MAG: hypothetical protein HQ573_05420 [Desulfobacteraceae bacterium]|nr:hypothetical protein [Desulfobacteraceae bacterium]
MAAGENLSLKKNDENILIRIAIIENKDLLPLYEEEKAHIIRVLEATNYNKVRALKILDIPRTTLWRKIKKYDIIESLG